MWRIPSLSRPVSSSITPRSSPGALPCPAEPGSSIAQRSPPGALPSRIGDALARCEDATTDDQEASSTLRARTSEPALDEIDPDPGSARKDKVSHSAAARTA